MDIRGGLRDIRKVGDTRKSLGTWGLFGAIKVPPTVLLSLSPQYPAFLHETFGHHTYAWGHGDVSGTLRCFGVMAMFWGHGVVWGHQGTPGPPPALVSLSLGVPVPVVPNGTLGHYAYGGTEGGTRLRLCQRFFCRVDINPSNNTFDINPSIITGGDTWSLRFGICGVGRWVLGLEFMVWVSSWELWLAVWVCGLDLGWSHVLV